MTTSRQDTEQSRANPIMPHTQNKKQRLGGVDDDDNAAKGKATVVEQASSSFSSLSSEILAKIFGHLPLKEIMRSRRLCKKTIDAVKETDVPLGTNKRDFFEIDSIEKYNALVRMAEALPGLQQIRVDSQSYNSKYKNGEGEFKYNDGEDPIEVTAADGVITLNIDDLLSKFPKLHTLEICRSAPLNGRYSSLFNFSHLETLSIEYCDRIKFDFGMLAGLPSLKEFDCVRNKLVTGSLKSLGVCKDTLERINLACGDVPISGNLMDLANFPRLKSLNLHNTTEISGNLRDIDADNDDHFPMLEKLLLPSTRSGSRYDVMRIADAKQLIKDLIPLRRKRPGLFKDLHWKLSQASPDIIDTNAEPDMFEFRTFAFFFVQSGAHLGWRWEEKYDYTPDHPFEVHWLDQVPAEVASSFIPSGMKRFYKGYYEPPPYNVYRRLCRNYVPCAEEQEMWENL